MKWPHFDAQTAASQGNAVLGIRDSGKSYTAIAMAEKYIDAGIPIVAFDPIGRWRFMRVPGAGKGYPVVVAGGLGADIPLTTESAVKIMRAAMYAGISLIIDLYDINISKADWRRIVGDAVRVLLYENDSLRHIFIEEAAEFAPQRVGPAQGVVYAEIEKLARMGGNARLGYTLINQRAEEVNKAVLELCDNLFLHRQKGRNSLNALTKWLNLADVKPGSKEIIQSLPTLPQGECWAWMAGSDRPERFKVPVKNSFEPDRRAMRNETVIARSPIDVGEFVAQMRRLLTGKPAPKPAPPKPAAPQPPEDKTVKESEARALRQQNEELKAEIAKLRARLDDRTSPQPPAPSPRSVPSTRPPELYDIGAIYEEVKKRAMADPVLIKLLAAQPEIEVLHKRAVISLDTAKQPGMLALMITEGFFDLPIDGTLVAQELKRRGRSVHNTNVYRDLNNLAMQGFLTKEKDGYRAVAGMKINIREAA